VETRLQSQPWVTGIDTIKEREGQLAIHVSDPEIAEDQLVPWLWLEGV